MIICFECTQKTKKELDTLLVSEDYNDYSEIINLAISNLSVLHSELNNQGSITINSSAKKIFEEEAGKERSQKTKDNKKTYQISDSTYPDIFKLRPMESANLNFASLPNTVSLSNSNFEVNNWLFGQYNRYLPVKATCRALANLMINNGKGIKLQDLILRISDNISSLGNYLLYLNRKHNLHRDDSLAVAFPTRNSNFEKSKQRYINQFIASVDKSGSLSGMLYELKFINWIDQKESELALTKQGWDFAQLKNPVFDNISISPTQKFTLKEIKYLIEHLDKHVPKEIYSYRTLMRLIKSGNNTPTKLDNILSEKLSESIKQNYSEAFLSSQRSGAISRMADLGLVERIRKGKYIIYRIASIQREVSNILS